MAAQAQVQTLLQELGQRIGLDGLALDQDGYAALGFDEVLLGLELDEQTGQLQLYSSLGVPEHGELELYRAMLDDNLFWRATGGATLARESVTGALVLQQRVDAAGLDLAAFERLIKGFVDIAEGWMKRIAVPQAEVSAEVARPVDLMLRA